MKVFKIKCPTYDLGILLFIGDVEEFREYMWKKYKIDENVPVQAVAKTNWVANTETGEYMVYVWMPDWSNTLYDFRLLAHEFIHVMCNIYNRTGVWIDNDNQEPTAYFFDCLYGDAILQLNKWRDKEKEAKKPIKKRRKKRGNKV